MLSSPSKATSIEAHWPLLIPPLLALIDDASTLFKIRGCELLILFLAQVPFSLLERTGLGEVFQNALMPCLLYLPSLTPENESTAILEKTYEALFTLNRRLFPGDKHRRSRIKAFDKLVRDGIFKGYAHAGENVRIAELLVKKMTDLVNEIGIDSAKHLKVKPSLPLPPDPKKLDLMFPDDNLKAYNTFALTSIVRAICDSIPSPAQGVSSRY